MDSSSSSQAWRALVGQVSGERSHDEVASSILRFASILALLLVVSGLFALTPSASADKIVFTSVNRSGGGLVVMRPGGKVVSVARGFVEDWYDVSEDGRRLVRGTTIPADAALWAVWP
jgi:hypothetical protein